MSKTDNKWYHATCQQLLVSFVVAAKEIPAATPASLFPPLERILILLLIISQG
uniref:Uncharacterized protein n=1 Tax=Nelumbo nucifera TaxID=4432 RepID=A0A822ZHH3_NELNU|nr:TPA_asm: hypothetical protein HUJ06_000716 [Nelumbo nucifera]